MKLGAISWRRAAVTGAACIALAAGVIGVAANNAMPIANADTGQPTYQELVEMYPNEYNSAMTHKTDEEGEDNSHAGFQELMETPAVRDGGGAILEVVEPDDPRKTEIQVSCLSCKSSAIIEFYDEEGYDVFASDRVLSEQDMIDLDGRYWDCYGCHTWNSEEQKLELAANMMYANEDVFPSLAAFYDGLAPKEAVCGQCHNLAGARKAADTPEHAQAYNYYENGYTTDALFEQGYANATPDETAGVWQAWVNHPQIETFQDSVHQSLGLGCVDCHMPVVTDEDGNEYREHNASGSVYENDAAMEFCLTCHGQQNDLETVEDMRGFLKDAQDAQLKRQQEVEATMTELYDLLAEQTANQTVSDEVLAQAREDYSRAYYYVAIQQGNRFDPADGAEIAHDPDEFHQLLERADTLCKDAIEALS